MDTELNRLFRSSLFFSKHFEERPASLPAVAKESPAMEEVKKESKNSWGDNGSIESLNNAALGKTEQKDKEQEDAPDAESFPVIAPVQSTKTPGNVKKNSKRVLISEVRTTRSPIADCFLPPAHIFMFISKAK